MTYVIKQVAFAAPAPLKSLGRNGWLHTCGLRLSGDVGQADDSALWIQPVTSRGEAGQCAVAVPVAAIPDLIQALAAFVAARVGAKPVGQISEGAALETGYAHALNVVANWSQGDLAGAVNGLEEWAEGLPEAFPGLEFTPFEDDDED